MVKESYINFKTILFLRFGHPLTHTRKGPTKSSSMIRDEAKTNPATMERLIMRYMVSLQEIINKLVQYWGTHEGGCETIVIHVRIFFYFLSSS